MQLIISKVDITGIRHGERYPVKVFFESTSTAVVLGDDGQEHAMRSNQYTTEQEQRVKYNLAKAEDEQRKQADEKKEVKAA